MSAFGPVNTPEDRDFYPDEAEEVVPLVRYDDGDPQCAGGCGYPVEFAGELCGECSCEDDGDVY